jgi:signal transduction histidine kinase/ActR/RegA family two-component response regulator
MITLEPTKLAPVNEEARLNALHTLGILDTPAEPAFDRITRLACHIFSVPMAAISFVDQDRQWFKARTGMTISETPRSWSFCAHTVLQDEVFVVPNTLDDPRFYTSPPVRGEPEIRFYAGAPLRTRDGYNLGLLCIMNTVPAAGLDEIQRAILAGLAGVVVEQCESRRKECELAAAKEEAESANRSKGEFLSRVSHELRTPMNAILGFTQLLEMEDLSELQRSNVSRILRAGKHLLNLLNEVLEISRIDAGRLAVEMEPVKIAEVIHEASELVQPLLAERGIRLEIDAPPPAAETVLADPQKLAQVILNLLSNAIKYNREKGEIAVTHQIAGDHLQINVRDTGNGIPAALVPKLFHPFERLEADRTKTPGTGLGLALSKRMVELMGGSVGVESVPGEGSTFWIRVALSVAAAAPNPVEEPRVEPPAAGPTVLYIEDTVVSIHLINGILKRRTIDGDTRVRLISAMQGHLGIEMARLHAPDLILLDLHLPDISGIQVLDRLKSDDRTSAIPVVVLTADALPGTEAQVLAAGAAACLSKPVDVPTFLATITSILETSTKGKPKKKERTQEGERTQ